MRCMRCCRFFSHGRFASTGNAAAESSVITPWRVSSRGAKPIDYSRVLEQFRSQPLSNDVLELLTSTLVAVSRRQNGGNTPDLHPLFRRGTAFSHRDFDIALKDIKSSFESSGEFFHSVYLYTGRGPSSNAMHVGHTVPLLLCKYLQDCFDCPLVIQMTDDEKFLFRDLELSTLDRITTENIKDIIAFGFNPKRTFIFRNTQYFGTMYLTVLAIQRLMTCNAVKRTFGFSDSDSVGKYAFPATQAAPAFPSIFPTVLPLQEGRQLRCLIPCAIDQDPFFVMTRTIAPRLHKHKPSVIHTKFLPSLKGVGDKMSSSSKNKNDLILLNDSKEEISKKMRKAFSGGRATMGELQACGADLKADVAFTLLSNFMEDGSQLERIAADYEAGVMSSADVKQLATDVIWEFLSQWRARRLAVSQKDVEQFCTPRNILAP